MPNETLEAPSVMFTPNSSRSSAIVSSVLSPSVVSAPTGMASGSITMSSMAMPYFPVATSMILRASSTRRRGSSGISSSSLGSAMTAAPYLRDQRQDGLQPLVLGGDRVDQRLALVGGEPGVEHLDDRGVDAQRQVGEALDELDRLDHELGLVHQRGAHVDVEHHGAARHLLRHVDLHPGQVAVRAAAAGRSCARSG